MVVMSVNAVVEELEPEVHVGLILLTERVTAGLGL